MFSHLKVLELASVLAGPSVGQFFAELGAEVIKVENPATGGDVTRTWKLAGERTGDRSAYFCSVNWGKRSVTLDLHDEQDRARVYDLALKADVVIASYKPGDAEKLGVDYETLAKLNPRLVYAQISGYGPENPRVGYDAIIQAEAGFMFMNGEPGGASLKMPVALVDVLAAHHLKEGILLALLNRERTGKGDKVEVSLIQAAAASLVNQATNWLVAGKLPQKQGSAHPNIAPYGDVYITADTQEILLAVGSDRQFQDLCAILEIQTVAQDARFKTNAARVENRIELNALLQTRMALYTADILIHAMHRMKIPAGFIQNMQQVFETPEVKELLLNDSGITGVRSFVAKLGSVGEKKLSAPPGLGEHTKEILS
ncbi:MAG TPA: CoA transferase [Ohtaekwangia sp.]|uniref:CaiB/BaiF CoA transferase family protein n=1 Tax=Ohtaekwangia sp. TaxID=2066019 RepID=UPI002F93ED3F